MLTIAACNRERESVVVGSKNFSESVILGELIAQTLESAGCNVDRRLNLGGTLVCARAIQAGSIDVYAEYSGTALTAILRRARENEPAAVDAIVGAEYQRRGLSWGPSFGFNNTFAILVRETDASSLGLRTIGDLRGVRRDFQPGFGYEFTERPDGWPGLQAHYGLNLEQPPRIMDLGLTYKALASGQVDVIAGNSTDGLIASLGLHMLEDDRAYFPPYAAAVVAHTDVSRKCAGARAALDSLAGRLDDEAMRRLNYQVDGGKRDVAEVVHEFLQSRQGR